MKNTDEEPTKKKNAVGTIADINKRYGYKIIGTALEMYGDKGLPRCTTGNWQFDLILGGNEDYGFGAPLGRILEFFGDYSTFKSSALYKMFAQYQRAFPEKKAALIATEEFDAAWAANFGVDLAKLHVAQPAIGNEAVDIMKALVLSGEYSIIGLDSIAASVPQEEMERSAEEYEMAPQAKLINKMLRTIAGGLNTRHAVKTGNSIDHVKNETTIVLINQNRVKFGGMPGRPQYTQPGGEGKKFFASIRVEFRIVDCCEVNPEVQKKDGEDAVAKKGDEFSELKWVDVGVIAVKNKTFVPKKKAVFRMYLVNTKRHKIGDIDNTLGAFRVGESMGIIHKKNNDEKSKIWCFREHEVVGKNDFLQLLYSRPDIAKAVVKEIKKRYLFTYTPKLIKELTEKAEREEKKAAKDPVKKRGRPAKKKA